MSVLFLDGATATRIEAAMARVRGLVRGAARYTTKAESATGQAANRALHEAEAEIDKALALLGGVP